MKNEIEFLDASSESFEDELEFTLWSTNSSSDYRNDRYRPYNGQSWTCYGERGETLVEGLTMRDIFDCLIKAMIISSPATKEYWDNFDRCWDF